MDSAKRTLKEVAQLLEESRRTDNLLRSYLTAITRSFNVRRVSLMLVDSARRELFIRDAQGYAASLKKKIRVRIGEGVSGRVAQQGEGVIVRDIARHSKFRQEKKAKGFKSGSFMSLPLKMRGTVYGVLNVSEKKDGTHFSNTELKRLEFFGMQLAILVENEMLRKELRRLEKKPAELIAETSHDFRIPLTCVQEALNLMESGDLGPVSDNQKEFLALARRNVDRMLLAFDELICLATGRAPGSGQRKDIDVMEIFSELARDFGPLARKKQTRIEIHGPKTMKLHTDGLRLREILMNFLDNAIKFTPQNSAVIMTASESGTQARLSVQDQGPGLSREARKTIFSREEALRRRSETADPQRRSHGLGMIIAAEISEGLGGRAGYDDAPDGGAVFYVELPFSEHKKLQKKLT